MTEGSVAAGIGVQRLKRAVSTAVSTAYSASTSVALILVETGTMVATMGLLCALSQNKSGAHLIYMI